jgi:hypothetical protein
MGIHCSMRRTVHCHNRLSWARVILMALLIANYVADILDIVIKPTAMYEQGGRQIEGNQLVITVMGGNWGQPGTHTCYVPKAYMHNFWPIRNPVTGLPELPVAALDARNNLKSGTYTFTDLVPMPIPLTDSQRKALRRAANGDIGTGTNGTTVQVLVNAGYIAPGTTTITKAGIAYLTYCDTKKIGRARD